MEYNATIGVMIPSILAGIALAIFGPAPIKNVAWVGLYGMAFIAALDQIQSGAPYIVWNVIALTVGAFGGLELRKLYSPFRQWPRRERKAMRALFGYKWYHVFTEDPRIAQRYAIDVNFNHMGDN